ncbi:hypothetical protein ABIF64_008159 [Bradyrhizobium japonicum]|jgi:hypothetical protein|nr:hypothetical protein [Bradyrhizobium japonicum]BAL08563.1 hypothetical protein BJ6T_32890 [Bradyrhizobium japonicum USDA 6]MCP1786141.1 hypothetical protein [Bradyrhizobium japonicum]MCP1808020.1 hypothetical protein [Bradyrhizobium japonicum]MCP1816947.1 hypothetical protein [Bradyrhizobium japonicum]
MRVAASPAISDNAFSRWRCRDLRWSDSGAAKVRTWADPLQEHPGISFQRPEARKHDVGLPNSTTQPRARHTWLTGSRRGILALVVRGFRFWDNMASVSAPG